MSGHQLLLVSIESEAIHLGIVAVLFYELERVRIVAVQYHIHEGIVQGNAVRSHVGEVKLGNIYYHPMEPLAGVFLREVLMFMFVVRYQIDLCNLSGIAVPPFHSIFTGGVRI